MSSTTFNPRDIADLSGRIFFITGGTAGLGAQTISLLATKRPTHIFFSGRNSKKAEAVIAKVKEASPETKVTFIQCDLTDLSSVRQAGQSLLAQTDRLDVFIANAGVMALPPGKSKDGYEIQFATNHLGHALLTKIILPIMLKTAEQPGSDVRIINLSSTAYKQAPTEGFAFATLKTDQASLGGMVPGGKWGRYGQSKLANLSYAQALAKRFPTIKTVSIHPGYVKTDLFASTSQLTMLPLRFMVPMDGGWTPVEQGCWNQVWAATTARQNLEDGAYYVPVAKKGKLETAQSRDASLSDRLYEWTEKELALWM